MSVPSSLGAALVTGASTGIGAVYADRLAKRGHDLILVARDDAKLQALAERLRAETGVAVDVVRADLTDKADLKALEQRLATDPSITLLVNNAGVALGGGFLAADPDRLESLIDLNITALTRLAHAAALAFKARGAGTIVNVASVVALVPEFRMSVYSASKAYVLHLTQALDLELAGSGVRLQAVLPAATRTEIWGRSGLDLHSIEHVMEASDLVDGALAGFDQGELITIPMLKNVADWEALEIARLKLGPDFEHNQLAARYGLKAAGPA